MWRFQTIKIEANGMDCCDVKYLWKKPASTVNGSKLMNVYRLETAKVPGYAALNQTASNPCFLPLRKVGDVFHIVT